LIYNVDYFYRLRTSMFTHRGISLEEAKRATLRERKKLQKIMPVEAICLSHLDNPLMDEDVRAFMVRDSIRARAARSAGSVSAARERRRMAVAA